jgi:hypothetical protein
VKDGHGISDRAADVLRALARSHINGKGAMTGNQVGTACGFTRGQLAGQCNHAGRAMGPAQHVISTLTALRKFGYVCFAERRDGLSGTAYALTPRGWSFCELWGLR